MSGERNNSAVTLGLCGLIVALAPLFRGGNRWVPLTVLEWLALLLLLWLAWQTHSGRLQWQGLGQGWRRWALLGFLATPVLMAAMHLLPMPGAEGWRPLSAAPDATWGSALAALPVLALMLVALVLPARALVGLAYLWMAAALLQALLGLAQLSGAQALWFGMPSPKVPVGSFGNRNLFASFLLMSVPLFVWSIRRSRSGRRGSSDDKAFWLGLVGLFLVLMALLASLSRAGQTIGALLAVASGWLFWRPRAVESGWQRWAWTGAPVLLLLALGVGGLDWVSRFFDTSQLASDAAVRAQNRDAAFEAALAYLPWGAGLGTFASVFPPFQTESITPWVEHAHNDYAQWLVEGGLMAFLAMGLGLALGVRRLAELARGNEEGSRHRSNDLTPDARLVVACGLGLAGCLLHAWVDFPLRIPANAMLAGFLAGVFLRVPVAQR